MKRIRDLSQDSSNIVWTTHVREQMNKRGIDSEDVLRILRTGDVENAPTQGRSADEWKMKVTRKMRGGRVAGVVTILVKDQTLRLITAEWEDYR